MEEVSVQSMVPLNYIRRSCSEQRQPRELTWPVSHLHWGFRWEFPVQVTQRLRWPLHDTKYSSYLSSDAFPLPQSPALALRESPSSSGESERSAGRAALLLSRILYAFTIFDH